jgi:hypothetical protein
MQLSGKAKQVNNLGVVAMFSMLKKSHEIRFFFIATVMLAILLLLVLRGPSRAVAQVPDSCEPPVPARLQPPPNREQWPDRWPVREPIRLAMAKHQEETAEPPLAGKADDDEPDPRFLRWFKKAHAKQMSDDADEIDNMTAAEILGTDGKKKFSGAIAGAAFIAKVLVKVLKAVFVAIFWAIVFALFWSNWYIIVPVWIILVGAVAWPIARIVNRRHRPA